MLAPFLVMVREGFEAALVVVLVFAYLRRIDRLDLGRSVWVGVAAAVGVSISVGIVIRATVGELAGAGRLRAFAAISIVAVAVLTWMVFWMRSQARSIRPVLESKVDRALGADNVGAALVLVAFVAVLREGIEAVLFMLALSDRSSPTSLLVGAGAGLVVAALLAGVVYLGGRRLPMRLFFSVTGVVLIVFAAGLLARSVQLLQAGHDLGSVNLNGVYDLRDVSWLTTRTEVGRFLAALFGWDPRPSLEQVVAWVGYLVPVGWLFLRPARMGSRAAS
ncbi:MAG: FTR1 family protein [Acidimicrobiales bacterium]|nr:FTR1 family protein [Acidimicrobiales bacterium]